ncbi:MAG: PEP-CTERM sorting domain-containing protein, partial [Puniceicoccales bacterium]|nr:PEP-CTERM sorting domain-containing protein [Puniceicoccales bacterium]
RETAGLSFVSKTDWIIGDTTNNNTVILSKFNSSDNTNYGTGGAWYSDTADVTATGKAVYIGKSNGASGNKLIVEGDLRTNKIYIGSANGANNNTLIVSGNTLKGGTSGQIKADEIHIGSESSQGNVLKLEGTVNVTLATGATVWLHRGNMLIIQEVHVGSGPGGEDLPLAPTEVVATLELKTIQLKAGWLTEGENLVSTANAEQLISTSTRADMPGYTIVRAAGGETPEPSTYALWGSGLLAGLVFLRHRRRRKG